MTSLKIRLLKLRQHIAMVVLFTIAFSLFPIMSHAEVAEAAGHVHTADCYTTIGHSHIENECYVFSQNWSYEKYGGSNCPFCSGTGNFSIYCDICEGSRKHYHDRSCDGILSEAYIDKSTTTGSCRSCSNNGGIFNFNSYVYPCSVCSGVVLGYYEVVCPSCGTVNGGGASGYFPSEGMLHSEVYQSCKRQTEITCPYCSGTGSGSSVSKSCTHCYATGNLCNTCGGSKEVYHNKSCSGTLTLYEKITFKGVCTDCHHNESYEEGQMWVKCDTCETDFQLGGFNRCIDCNITQGGPVTGYGRNLYDKDAGYSIKHSNIYATCGEFEFVHEPYDCPACNEGKQWLSTFTCTKTVGTHYNENGSVSTPICDKVVTSLVPTKSTQTINAGTSPVFTATATFLDGHTETVNCTASGYVASKYNQAQTVTLSYGTYRNSAKISGAKSTTAQVTVNGNFTLTVSSDNTSMGTVTGGGTKLADSSVTVTATPKTGYAFEGWYVSGIKVSTSASYTFTMPKNAYALVANFKAINYNLTITSEDTNKGTVSGSSGSIAYDSSCSVTASPNTGYSFAGWYEGSNRVSSSPTYTFTMGASARTLQARFTTNNYTLTIQSENTSKGTVSGTSGSVAYGTSCTVLASPKSGYSFAGWYNGSTKVSNNASYTFSMGASSLTLQARFTANNYSLSISSANTAMGTVSGSQGSITYLSQCTVYATSKTGYSFAGWYNGNTRVSDDASYTFNMPYNNLSLEARFTVNSHTLTIRSEDTAKGTVTGSQGSINYGTQCTIVANPNTGYSFAGWYEGSNKVCDDRSYSFTFGDNARTLTAKFNGIPYRVTFNPNEGSVSVSYKDYTYGSLYSDLPTPTRSGYDFTGWKLDNANITTSSRVSTASNHTLIASWTPSRYTITFDSNGGSSQAPTVVSYASQYGTLPTPVKTGHTFDGWYLNNTKITSQTQVTATSNHTLTAKWIVNKYKVIVMNVDGSRRVQSEHLYNSDVTIDAGVKPASWFTGWEVIDGDSSVVNHSEDVITFKMPATDMVLNATWNDVVSITSSLNDSFVSSYAYAFISDKNSYNIDLVRNNQIVVNKSMLDVYVVFEDSSKQLVTDVADFDIVGSPVTTIGTSNIVVTLNTIQKSDGSKFSCYSTVRVHSASIDNVMADLGISTYKELADYISRVQSDYADAVGKLNKYDEALEVYRDLLNQAGDNNIILDSNLVANLGRIEVGIRNLLAEITDYQNQLVLIQNAIIDAGGDLGEEFNTHDGNISTIMTQISILKTKLDSTIEECNELNGFCSDLKTLLGLDENASFQDIFDAIKDLQAKLEKANGELADYDTAVRDINVLITGGNDSSLALNKKLDTVIGNVLGIQTDLLAIAQRLDGLVVQTGNVVDGSDDSSTQQSAKEIYAQITDLQSFIETLEQNADKTVDFASQLKELLDLESDASFEDIVEAVKDLKEELDQANKDIVDYRDAINEVNNGMFGGEEETTLAEALKKATEGVSEIKSSLSTSNKELINLQAKLDKLVDGSSLSEGDEYTADTIDAELENLSIYLEELNRSLDDANILASELKKILGLEDDAGMSDIISSVSGLKQSLADANELISNYSDSAEEILKEVYSSTDETTDLGQKLALLLHGVSQTKVNIQSINGQLINLLGRTNEIITGSNEPSDAYEATNTLQEISDLQDYTNNLASELLDISVFISEIKTLLEIPENSSLQEIFDKVQEHKERMEIAEGKVAQYEEALKNVYDKLGQKGDNPEDFGNPEELDAYLKDALSGLDTVKTSISDIDTSVNEMIKDLQPYLNSEEDDSEVPSEAIDVVIEDLSHDIDALKVYLKDVLQFADNVSELFGFVDEDGNSLPLDEVLEKLETVKSEYDIYISMIKRLEELIASGEVSDQNLDEQLDYLYERVDGLKTQLENTDAMLDAEFGDGLEIKEVKDSIQKLKEQLADALKTIEYLENTVADKNTIISFQGDRITDLERLNSEKDIRIAELLAEIERLKSELTYEGDEVSRLQKDLAESRSEVASLTADLVERNDRVSELTDGLLESDAMILELKKSLDMQKSVSQSLSFQLIDSESEMNKLKEELKVQKTQLDTSKAETFKLKEELKVQKTQLDTSKAETSKLKEELTTEKAENKELNNAVDVLETKIETLKGKSTQIVTLESEIVDLKNEIADKERAIQALKNNNASSKSSIANFESEVADLKSKLADKEKEISSLSSERVIKLESTVKTLEEKVASKDKEIETLKGSSSSAKEVTALKTEVETLKRNLELSKKEVINAESVAESYKTNVVELNNELKQKEKEITQLRSDNAGLTDYSKDTEKQYHELLLEVTKLKNATVSSKKTTNTSGSSNYMVDEANRYSGLTLSTSDDTLSGIKDNIVNGNRVVYIDEWITKDGVLLANDGYLLSFFSDYAWCSSLDVLRDSRSDEPKVLEDVMLYEIDMTSEECTTYVIHKVNYQPSN